eukprot:SAG31_NODE_32718_length_352_cov_1.007905_1_plen_28_part_01
MMQRQQQGSRIKGEPKLGIWIRLVAASA